MSAVTTEPLALLGRAADLRARGILWDEVATALAVGLDDLRRLAAEQARAYRRLERAADREYRLETMGAAVARLRGLLKSADEHVALSAATTLIRYDLALLRHRAQARADRRSRRPKKRRRAESPAAPDACPVAVPARSNGPSPAPQVPAVERVAAVPTGAQKSAQNGGSGGVPAAPAPRGATTIADDVRRRKWLPPGLAVNR